MEKLGTSLQNQRKSLKISIEDLGASTRIPLRFIEAIEADDFSKLPNHVSAKGFLRSYAEAVELDPAEISAAYSELCDSGNPLLFTGDRDSLLSNLQVNRPSHAPFPRRIVVSVVTVVVLLLVVVAFFPKNGSDTLLNSTQTLSPEQVFQGSETSSLEESVLLEKQTNVSVSVASETPNSAPEIKLSLPTKESVREAPLLAEKRPLPDKITETSSDNSVIIPDETVPPSSDVEEPGSETVVSILEPSDVLGESSEPVFYILSLEATEPSWVEVTIDDDEVKEALLQPDDRVEWRAKEKFKLTLGNAGGVKVSLNGQDLGALGDSGDVVHKEITADLLKKTE